MSFQVNKIIHIYQLNEQQTLHAVCFAPNPDNDWAQISV
ncbi:hypothetical protein L911_1773 [Vibrio fluvialis I21563]|nr:hypothetical protein L911_1773 [Vibrio fluvialis I21563]